MNELKKWLIRHLSHKARPYLKTYGLLQTVKFFNKSLIVWEPDGKRVLVLAPHFDDEVIGCGGTLYKHIQKGAEVSVVFLTDGHTGSNAPSNPSLNELKKAEEEIVEVRRGEAELALKTLGIRKWFCLDFASDNLISTTEMQSKVLQIIQSVKPDIVYLPSFWEEHPDHQEVTQILLDATNNSGYRFDCFCYEIWAPLFPNILVNIDNSVEIKRQALQQYKSQMVGKDYIHTTFGLNAYRSIAMLDRDIKYAEAFFRSSLEDYRKLYYQYKSYNKN